MRTSADLLQLNWVEQGGAGLLVVGLHGAHCHVSGPSPQVFLLFLQKCVSVCTHADRLPSVYEEVSGWMEVLLALLVEVQGRNLLCSWASSICYSLLVLNCCSAPFFHASRDWTDGLTECGAAP